MIEGTKLFMAVFIILHLQRFCFPESQVVGYGREKHLGGLLGFAHGGGGWMSILDGVGPNNILHNNRVRLSNAAES